MNGTGAISFETSVCPWYYYDRVAGINWYCDLVTHQYPGHHRSGFGFAETDPNARRITKTGKRK